MIAYPTERQGEKVSILALHFLSSFFMDGQIISLSTLQLSFLLPKLLSEMSCLRCTYQQGHSV